MRSDQLRLMPLSLAVLLSAVSCSHQTSQVSFVEAVDRIDVLIDDRPVTAFHFGSNWDKPFLHPVHAPNGRTVSRGWPLVEVEGESRDHVWHRGIWFAHGDINGVDFWREATGVAEDDARLPLPVGTIVARGAPEATAGETGMLTAAFDLVGPDGEAIGSLRHEWRFSRLGAGFAIDLEATVIADRDTSLSMGDTEEGTLGIRFDDAFRQDRGATLKNASGLTGTENIWGKRATWVDYAAVLDRDSTGVALFDAPSNPKHPTYWHARGYGLCAANPFGEHDFLGDPSVDGSMTIPTGDSLRFRYRVLVHDGFLSNETIDGLWSDFAASSTP